MRVEELAMYFEYYGYQVSNKELFHTLMMEYINASMAATDKMEKIIQANREFDRKQKETNIKSAKAIDQGADTCVSIIVPEYSHGESHLEGSTTSTQKVKGETKFLLLGRVVTHLFDVHDQKRVSSLVGSLDQSIPAAASEVRTSPTLAGKRPHAEERTTHPAGDYLPCAVLKAVFANLDLEMLTIPQDRYIVVKQFPVFVMQVTKSN